MRSWILSAAALLTFAGLVHAGVPADPAVTDPPADVAHPTRNQQLLVPTHGEEINALLMLASGDGAKPTVVLLHGLPGNEQNLDLAQAIRRAGWHVLTLHYRGSWGSPGSFSIANSVQDAGAAVAFLRRPEVAAKYGIDVRRLVLGGHSMGAFAAAMTARGDEGLAGVFLLDAWNAGDDARALRETPALRGEFVAGIDDLGHSLAGADPESLVVEIERAPADWDLLTAAPQLANRPLLTIWADRGGAEQNIALADAIRAHDGARLTAQHFPSDHPFSDHRIALARAVVAWLQALPAPAP